MTLVTLVVMTSTFLLVAISFTALLDNISNSKSITDSILSSIPLWSSEPVSLVGLLEAFYFFHLITTERPP